MIERARRKRCTGEIDATVSRCEYDFSQGERERFYRPDIELHMPVYLDSDVADAVRQYASKGKTEIGALVNEWLRRDIMSMAPSRKLRAR
jgi:hypothetical protein